MWTKRGKACLILIFSTNTNCESMAYRSFRSEEYSARGVRKVTTGTTKEGAAAESRRASGQHGIPNHIRVNPPKNHHPL